MQNKFNKIVFIIAIMFISVCFVSVAMAQEYVFDKIHATMDIPEGYIVVNSHSLDTLTEWLEKTGKSKQAVLDDFNARGILLQAWSEKGDICIEVSANETEKSKMIFDVDERSPEIRGAWRVSFHPNNDYLDTGYDFKSANWKNTGTSGRFLILKYYHEVDGNRDYSAFSRKTIKNGYEISIDLKAFGRALSTQDNTTLNKIWKTWKFTEILPPSKIASASINIVKSPPEETKSQKIVIAGEATEGVQFTAVVMSLGSTNPDIIKATADAKSKFEIPIVFAKQGVYLITLTAAYKNEDINEWAFPITYKETLLAVNFAAEMPKTVNSKEYKIKGTAEKSATIQILLNNKVVGQKRVTPDGKFAITIDTSKPGENELVLVFSKKGLQNRRFKFDFLSELTEPQVDQSLTKGALKPSYAKLKNQIDTYIGKTINASVYFVSSDEYNEGSILKLAYTKTKDKYSNYIYAISDKPIGQEQIGKKINVYGECLGKTSVVAKEVSLEEDVPIFNLILILDK